MSDRPTFTLGIEEEYFIVDRKTRELVRKPDPAFLDACHDALGDQVTNEFLLCQVEVGTKPHRSVADAASELAELRASVAKAAEPFGYAPIAASTHPFSAWRDQTHTPKERYDGLAEDLGQTVRRKQIAGMHIHIGIEDEELRIDLMNQVAYFLPHFLALSCSSPFWEGEDTGLASYRLTVFDALPRTGLPDTVNSYTEYRRVVEHLVKAGCIEDATKIWWDIRPSDKFPTLESRVTDICSRVVDAAAIAALYQCLIAHLYRLKGRNQRWRLYPRTMIMENRWRAQRYGAQGKLVDHGRSRLTSFETLIEELIDLVAAEAEMLNCVAELKHLRCIVRDGSSAERQRAAFKEGGGNAVVDMLIEEFTEA